MNLDRLINEVTLTAISDRPMYDQSTIRALEICLTHVPFKNVQFLTLAPDITHPKINVIKLDRELYPGYNQFLVKKYNDYIETPHMLYIHDDGFIVNPHLWEEEFLNYDYIGAPWPVGCFSATYPITKENRVGNGGFTLRSKKFLEIAQSKATLIKGINEDELLCRTYRSMFESDGMKYAPFDIAGRFAIEHTCGDLKNEDSFGFHSRYHRYYQPAIDNYVAQNK